MYNLRYSKRFKNDYKKVKRNPRFLLSEFRQVVSNLVNRKDLDRKYQNHKLHSEWKDCCECHLTADILLIYEINQDQGIVYMYRIGSHSELF